MEIDFLISEILSDSYSVDKETCWLKCKTGSEKTVIFWGELGEKNRNIVSIRNQKLPVHITILEPEECNPTPHEKREYDAWLSIPSCVSILINPEH